MPLVLLAGTYCELFQSTSDLKNYPNKSFCVKRSPAQLGIQTLHPGGVGNFSKVQDIFLEPPKPRRAVLL